MQDRNSLLAEKAELEKEVRRKGVNANSLKVSLNGTFRQARLDVLQDLQP